MSVLIEKKEYPGLDLLKCLISLLVVRRHGFSGVGYYLTALTCCAVPCFFCISGFLYGLHDDKEGYWKKYIVRLLKLYGIWSVVYLPLNLLSYRDMKIGEAVLDYFQNAIFSGTYWHLWYFSGLIIATLWVVFMCKLKLSYRIMLVIASLFFLFGLIGDSWSANICAVSPGFDKLIQGYRTFFVTTRNGLFYGLFYVLVGYLIAKTGKSINAKKTTFFVIVGLVSLLIETTIVMRSENQRLNMLLSAAPMSIGLFYLFSNITSVKHNKRIRNLSTLVYTLHVGILIIVGKLIEQEMLAFIVALIVTVIISMIVEHLSRKIKLLKILY